MGRVHFQIPCNEEKNHGVVCLNKEYLAGHLLNNMGTDPPNQSEEPDGLLIPGLSDDIAKSCLSLVPRSDFPAMSCVAKAWKALLQSKEFHFIRKDSGMLEEWLYALTVTQDCQKMCWQVFSPNYNEWNDLPPMPGPSKCGSGFVVIDGKLLVIGGLVEEDAKSTAVADVLVYNSALNRWSKVASMHTPRYEFACAVLGGSVYVVGGHGTGGKNLSSVEVYDPLKDDWTNLPSLKRARWGCIGCGLEGKLFVMGGRSSFTIGHSRCVDIYDPATRQWEETKNGCVMVLTHAIVDKELFCIEWKNDMKLAVYNAAENSWKKVALPLAGSLSVGFCLASLMGKLLLFPTKTEAPCETFLYDPHASSGAEWQTTAIKPVGTCVCCATIAA